MNHLQIKKKQQQKKTKKQKKKQKKKKKKQKKKQTKQYSPGVFFILYVHVVCTLTCFF